jgi:hypothetical protein
VRAAAHKSVAKRKAQVAQFDANVLEVIKGIRKAGVTSLSGIATALNARGVATANGGRWYPMTVRNILSRHSFN